MLYLLLVNARAKLPQQPTPHTTPPPPSPVSDHLFLQLTSPPLTLNSPRPLLLALPVACAAIALPTGIPALPVFLSSTFFFNPSQL